jgi:Protein of unknown function (DUF3574)
MTKSHANSWPMTLAFVLFLAMAGRPASAHAACFESAKESLVVELLFGRNIGNRLGVYEAAFQKFLDSEVTPRFPDGFSLLDMRGQYRSEASKTIVREPGKYLLIALGDEARDVPKVREVVEAYKRRFKQQSVGIIARKSCVSF